MSTERKGIRHMDIAFGDVLYRPAHNALEYGWNPDVKEVEENNKIGEIRECADNGHPKRQETAHGRWYCVLCTGDCKRPTREEGGTYVGGGSMWISDAYAVAEALR